MARNKSNKPVSEHEEIIKELNENQKKFCHEYIFDWNATRAYKAAYPKVTTDNSAAVSAYDLLRNPKIDKYISEIQQDIAKEAGISRLRIAKEYEKLAFSSMASIHNTWIERWQFEMLPDGVKDAIQEIDTRIQTKNIGDSDKTEIVDVEYVKVKFYSKQAALDSLAKMFGYNEPEKLDLSTKGDKLNNLNGYSTEELRERIKLKKELEKDE